MFFQTAVSIENKVPKEKLMCEFEKKYTVIFPVLKYFFLTSDLVFSELVKAYCQNFTVQYFFFRLAIYVPPKILKGSVVHAKLVHCTTANCIRVNFQANPDSFCSRNVGF